MNNLLHDVWTLATAKFVQERGATTSEYALVTILIGIVAIAAVVLVGEETSGMYTVIADEMTAAGSN